jgi:hypothetical protein
MADAAIPGAVHPIRIRPVVPWTAVSYDDHPVDADRVQARQWTQQRHQG